MSVGEPGSAFRLRLVGNVEELLTVTDTWSFPFHGTPDHSEAPADPLLSGEDLWLNPGGGRRAILFFNVCKEEIRHEPRIRYVHFLPLVGRFSE